MDQNDDQSRPRFELREVRTDGSERVEVSSLGEVARHASEVALSRKAFWGLSTLVAGGLIAACAPADGSGSATATQRPASATQRPATMTPRSSATPSPKSTPRPATSPTAEPRVLKDADRCEGLTAHQRPIVGIAYTPDGKLIVSAASGRESGSKEATIKLWNAADGNPARSLVQTPDAVAAIALSSDGKRVAAATPSGAIHVWIVESGLSERTFSWPMNAPCALAFVGDELIVAAQSGKFAVFGLDSPKPVREFALPKPLVNVTAIAPSPDGKSLAVGLGQQNAPGPRVHLIDVRSGVSIRALSSAVLNVAGLAFAPKGGGLAIADDGLRIQPPGAGETARAVKLSGGSSAVSSVAFDASGRILAVGRGSGEIVVVDVADWKPRLTIAGHQRGKVHVALSPDGTRIASAGPDRRILLWDPAGDGRGVETCFFDPESALPSEEANTYRVTAADGTTRTYTLPCGSPLPSGAVCTCNCVPGRHSVAKPPTKVPVKVPSGNSPGGGSYCSCNKVCTCIPVRSKYCFVMWD